MDRLTESFLLREAALQKPEARRDIAFLEATLHPSFREFGRSGGEYDRQAVITALVSEPVQPSIWMQDAVALQLDDRTVLLTYRSAIDDGAGRLDGHANRSSIWVKTDSGWQIVFHQGTPTGSFQKSGVCLRS